MFCVAKPPLQNRRQTESRDYLQSMPRCEGGRVTIVVKGGGEFFKAIGLATTQINQCYRWKKTICELRSRVFCVAKPPLQNRRQTESRDCLQSMPRCEGGRATIVGQRGGEVFEGIWLATTQINLLRDAHPVRSPRGPLQRLWRKCSFGVIFCFISSAFSE